MANICADAGLGGPHGLESDPVTPARLTARNPEEKCAE